MRGQLVCSRCERAHPWSCLGACPACGGVVEVRYDLTRVALGREGPPTVRYRDLLPLDEVDPRLDGGEGGTPCVHARELGAELGLSQLWIKVEGENPTGTTKDRQAPVLVGTLRELGVRRFVTASTGNASTSLARIARRFPDLEVDVFVGADFLPRLAFADAPNVRVHVLPGGRFADAGRAARWFAKREGATLDDGFFFFGKREGLKTTFYEAAEQVPRPIEVYVQSVSSGMGVVATRQAARELRGLGRIPREPRLVCVQEDTCDPMVRSFGRGAAQLHPADVIAEPSGLSLATLRGDPAGSYPVLQEMVRASGGAMVSVGAEALCRARERARGLEGLALCPTSAMTVAAAEILRRQGAIDVDTVVLLNATGTDRMARGTARADFRVERAGEGFQVTPTGRRDEIQASVLEALARVKSLPEGEALGPGTVLLDGGLGLDSVGVLELLLALEKRFACQIASREVTPENLGTVGALVALLERKLAEDPG